MASELTTLNTAGTLERSPISAATNGSQNNSQPAATERPVDAMTQSAEAIIQNRIQVPTAAGSEPKSKETWAATHAEETEQQDQAATIGTLSAKELREVLDEINSALYSYNRALKFELHDKTDDLVVRVLNTRTDEVIRQYPSEEVLARKARLLEGDTHFFSAQVS